MQRKAVQSAVKKMLACREHSRLAAECAKLDPKFEKALAEEGLGQVLEAWPEYKAPMKLSASNATRSRHTR